MAFRVCEQSLLVLAVVEAEVVTGQQEQGVKVHQVAVAVVMLKAGLTYLLGRLYQ
jgi:hypothetical protein